MKIKNILVVALVAMLPAFVLNAKTPRKHLDQFPAAGPTGFAPADANLAVGRSSSRLKHPTKSQ